MSYGSDGAGYPEFGPTPPPDQEPYYGDSARQPQPRQSSRPEPYDPFQTRAHDQQAAERQRQARQPGPAQHGGGQHSGGQHGGGQRGRGRDAYERGGDGGGRPQQAQQYYGGSYGGDSYGPDQYGADSYGANSYSADQYGGDSRGNDDYGRAAYGGDPRGVGSRRADPRGAGAYGADAYGDDSYVPGTRAPGHRGRAADRLGATSLLEEDPYASGPDEAGLDPDDPDGPAGAGRRRRGRKEVPPHVRRRRKIVWRSILAAFLLIVGYVGVTLYPYLAAPGTDRLNARIAEWGRDHHLGWAVTWLENATYKAPPTGGSLSASQLAQLQGATAAPPPPKVKADLPTDIVPLASGTVPGEGIWHPVTMNASGVPIVEKAALRPDAQHTSDLAYVVWMNQKALSFTLHPGYQQPGGNWNTPDLVPVSQRANLVATWNGGFKVKPDDALAGFYAEGRAVVPLVSGKAAEVFYKDGSLKIGMWGRDETMDPTITAVRQNLSLLVDKGQVTVGPGDGSSQQWGYTIKNSYFIARSGVGMTATGDIVYVSGRFLSVYTLAELLKSAGAVSAMELDINPDWVSFMNYSPGSSPAVPTITKLWDFTQPADRYFQPSDRDFVSVGKR